MACLQQAAELTFTQQNIWLAAHVRPDGDTLGSMLGLALMLEKLGKRVARLCDDVVPDNYRFLPGADLVTNKLPEWPAELLITVDCDGLNRTGNLAPYLEKVPRIIDIDHHATEKAFGEIVCVDPGAAATAVLIYRLLQVMQLSLDSEIATCLYCGLVTDTGRFSFPNTNVEAFAVARELVAAGVKPGEISNLVYENRTLSSRRLLGRALTDLIVDPTEQVAWAVLDADDFVAAGTTETEGIIDRIREIQGLKAMILFSVNDNLVNVSLRSKGGAVDVGQIALQFGGGGHKEAAGCHIAGPVEPAVKAVVEAVRAALGLK